MGRAWARLPEAAARAHDYRDEAEREVDRNDAANLVQMFGRFREMFRVDGVGEAPPRREEQMREQQHHHNANALHDVDRQARAGESAQIEENHAVAAGEQDDDARPHPREEAAEHPAPQCQPRLGRKRSRRGAQSHIGEEHAADPHDGGEDMERDEGCHGGEASTSGLRVNQPLLDKMAELKAARL